MSGTNRVVVELFYPDDWFRRDCQKEVFLNRVRDALDAEFPNAPMGTVILREVAEEK